MRLRYLILGVVVGAVCTAGVTSVFGKVSSGGVLFGNGAGAKEISPVTGKKGAGDNDARAGFTAIIDGTQFCWAIAVKNANGEPAGLHIHKGGPSKNGPIVIPLDPPEQLNPGAKSGCESISSALAKDLRKHASHYYFNLHTSQFGAGALRGQLSWKTK
jgi:CHRD domain